MVSPAQRGRAGVPGHGGAQHPHPASNRGGWQEGWREGKAGLSAPDWDWEIK